MAELVLPSNLAVYDPLGGAPFPPLMTGHDGVCIHTMAGSFLGTDNLFHQNGWRGTESTVGVAGSGFCKQWVPWNRQADAMLDGNPRWLSIECADLGENFPPAEQANDENPPLTPQQIDRIVALCAYWCRKESHANCPSTWACHQSGIPAVWISTSCGRGIGVHRHGIDPWRHPDCPHWSQSTGKICPRSVRLRQVRDIVVPRVAAALSGQEDDMTPDESAKLDAIFKHTAGDGRLAGVYTDTAGDGRLKEVTLAVRALLKKPAPSAEEIAVAVVAKLPETAGGAGLTKADVTSAVREVFAEVRYTIDPADVVADGG